MEPLNNDRKVWTKPTVQSLNINKDTYLSRRNYTARETAKITIEDLFRQIPS